jgi:hypothetical protein
MLGGVSDGAAEPGRGVCVNCGYDLAAIADVDHCPECGVAVAFSGRIGVWGMSGRGLKRSRLGAGLVMVAMLYVPAYLVGIAIAVPLRLDWDWAGVVLWLVAVVLWCAGWLLIAACAARAVGAGAEAARILSVAALSGLGLCLAGLGVGSGGMMAFGAVVGVICLGVSWPSGLSLLVALGMASRDHGLRRCAKLARDLSVIQLGVFLVELAMLRAMRTDVWSVALYAGVFLLAWLLILAVSFAALVRLCVLVRRALRSRERRLPGRLG